MPHRPRRDRQMLPTGTCFDDGLDLIVDLVSCNAREDLVAVRLVHGICLLPDGERYAHAWVEHLDRGTAVFCSILNGRRMYVETTIAEYDAHFKVQERTHYTVDEAWRENMRSGHYGPWLERYRELCKDLQAAKARSQSPRC